MDLIETLDVEDERPSFVHRIDDLHILVRKRKVAGGEVLPDPIGTHGLRNGNDTMLLEPLENHLSRCFAIAAPDIGKCFITQGLPDVLSNAVKADGCTPTCVSGRPYAPLNEKALASF